MTKAFVTGGSRGIGSGIVRCLAAAGYDVVFTYRSKKDEADKLVEELTGKYGVKSMAMQAALEQPGEGVKAFHKAIEFLGGLTLLVNNAGVTIFESILDLTEENLDYLIALDFRNYIILMREATRYMISKDIKGSIVNVTSTRSQRAYPADAIYGGLKAGLNRAIKSIALDVAPYGIRVNNVAPGAIRIRSAEEIKHDFGEGMPVTFWDDLAQIIPLKRSGLPEDIGNAVAFLASEKASYITGITVNVDGGLILPGMPEKTDGSPVAWGAAEKREIEYEI